MQRNVPAARRHPAARTVRETELISRIVLFFALMKTGKLLLLAALIILAEERMDALYAEDPLLSRVMADANAMFSRKASWKLWIQVRIRIQALTESFQDMLWRFLPRAWALIPPR